MKVDINDRDKDGRTALMWTDMRSRPQIVRYLLASPDIDPHIRNDQGLTALEAEEPMRACKVSEPAE